MEFWNTIRPHLAFKELIQCGNALEFQLDMRVSRQPAGMNKPFAAVDDEVGANLSLRAVRIQGTYLNDSVRLFKFIAQLRDIHGDDFCKRQRGVQEDFAGIQIIFRNCH